MFQAWLVKIAKIAAHSAPSTLPGNSAMKKIDRDREEAEDRDRLQNVEQRHEHQLGPSALRGERRDR